MTTKLPPYQNVSPEGREGAQTQGDIVWDVRDDAPLHRTPDPEPVSEPSARSEGPRSEGAGSDQSELLRRFPRPGAGTGRFESSERRAQVIRWMVGLFVAAASAAATAWVAAGF